MTLNLPGPTGRQWWSPSRSRGRGRGSGGESAWQHEADDGKRKPSDSAGYGFSAFSSHSFPLWISSDDPAIIGQIAMTELELLNAPLSGRQAESQVLLRTVATEGPRTLVHAVVIPAELEQPLPHKSVRLERFFPACFAYPLPRRRIVLWQEGNRWVVGFSRAGKMIHFHGFGRGPLDADAASEIYCLLVDLASRQQIDAPEAVLVWTDGDAGVGAESCPETVAQNVGDRLKLPVEVQPRPSPDTALIADVDCVPEAVVLEREEQRRRSKRMAIANTIAVVYVLAVVAAVASLYVKQKSNQQLALQIDDLAPAAEAVREARDRWASMSRALEVDNYPVELFHRVASLLPQKGVRLTHFEIRGDQIIVRGEASNVPMAIKFRSDLENSPDLKDYEWRQAAPEIDGDTAKFAAYGNHRFSSTSTPGSPGEG